MRALSALVERLRSWPRGLGALLLLGWMALIWFLSARPPADLTQGTAIGGWLANLAHAPAYGALALWLAIAARGRSGALAQSPRAAFWMLSFVAVYGLIDELHQSVVPGRDASALDLLTNLAGAASVLFALRALQDLSPGRARAGRTIAIGGLACCAAAALATLVPARFPHTTWL